MNGINAWMMADANLVPRIEDGGVATVRSSTSVGLMQRSSWFGCLGRRDRSIGFRPKLNGNMPRAREPTPPFGGVAPPARAKPTAANAIRVNLNRLCRSAHSMQIGSVFLTRRAMRRSGWKIAGMTITLAPRPMARPGPVGNVGCGYYAAAHSTVHPPIHGQRRVSDMTSTCDTMPTDSA